MKNPIELIFGAMVPSLKEQGVTVKASVFQKDADAITRLNIRGLLTDSETLRARQRLVNMINEEGHDR